MKLSEVKHHLENSTSLRFELPNGLFVPDQFHVTEVGEITKDFIDCGGKVRKERTVNFQLWEAGDYDHRLAPQKLVSIISLAEKVLQLGDWEVEVEYQSDTIGKYGLEFDGEHFQLTYKKTNCLANDACGMPDEKQQVKLSELQASTGCTPGGGCC
ncbi:MAG: hypothetical protein H7329_15855 [Opitutaceae bacterium]|nr:hypothetical protein [Cytophagales bacterium]